MSHWATYREFVVPQATYLQALYLGRSKDQSDLEKSRETMGRVVGITENSVAAIDYEDLAKGSLCPTDDCIWIVVEQGLGPCLVERRLDLPIPTPSGIITISLALPALESRTISNDLSFVILNSGEPIILSELASMDRVLQTEFQKRFPGIVTRAIAGATVKAVAQFELNKRAGALVGLIGNIVSAATTAADVRMWRSMSSNFMLSRIQRDLETHIVLRHKTGEEYIELPDSGAVLIYIKQLDPDIKPCFIVLGV